MTLSKQQLVDIVRTFYPSEPPQPTPLASKERQAFNEAWARAEQEGYARWHETIRAIRKDLPGMSVEDSSQGRSCASFRCVTHVKQQSLLNGAALETMVMGFKSVLAPVYGLAWGQRIVKPRRKLTDSVCPWRASSLELVEELVPITDVMAKHIEQASGYQRLTPELARVQVPRIYLDLGLDDDATLFDALLDSDPSNNP
jgi:hypothetical protein